MFDVDGDGTVDDHVFVTELCSRLDQVTYTKVGRCSLKPAEPRV